MQTVVVLLVAGLIALGLPKITHRDQRRFWHPWLNTGLLPMIIGLVLAPVLASAGDGQLGLAFQPVLAMALTAAGVLIGTQLRAAYLTRAGGRFIRRQSVACLGLWAIAVLGGGLALATAMLLQGSTPDTAFHQGIGVAVCLAPLVVATTQTPPSTASGFDVHHREIVTGHVAPAGWWNLLAVALAAIGIGLFFPSPVPGVIRAMPASLAPSLAVLAALCLGFGLGWLVVRCRNRDEAYLFLLAVIACGGGVALLLGLPPILAGMLIGAVFANVSLSRMSLIERVFEELEQPVAVGTGLVAGLVAGVAERWWIWIAVVAVVLVRLALRGRLGPTSATLCRSAERRLMPAGATGVLIVGSFALMGPTQPGLVIPGVAVLVVWTLLAELLELRRRD